MLPYARSRLYAFMEELCRLQTTQFPYKHSSDAVGLIKTQTSKFLDSLNTLTASSDKNTVQLACAESLRMLYDYVPLLGFVTRSTSARNSFEAYGPLLRLARTVLGPGTSLIISSEWDYSPFVYLCPGLTNFVLLGLPAPESSNPLLIPLAGHEFGHPLWNGLRCRADYAKPIKDKIVRDIEARWPEYSPLHTNISLDQLKDENNVSARETWQDAFGLAILQAEEGFCDLVGLRLFGEAYLHAFTYLVCPHTGRTRSMAYPNTKARAESLKRAATTFKYDVPSEFVDSIENEPEPGGREIQFLLSLADSAAESLVPQMIQKVADFAQARPVPTRTPEAVARVCEQLKRVVPAADATTLADIVNAGWQCHLDESLWADEEHIRPEDRDRILADLVLKSFEVLEITDRLKE